MPQRFLRSLGISAKYIVQNESLPVHVINIDSGVMSMDELLIWRQNGNFQKGHT